ncbi:MAG: hypothetical protein WD060_11550, partial [Pirellulales bacterium]
MPSLLKLLFCRVFGSTRCLRHRGVRRRESFLAQFDGSRTFSSHSSLLGGDVLEPRLVLAANDIVVSVVSNQVYLTLDAAGTAITDLRTSYSGSTLTITAATAGTISGAAPGITINQAADTIAVDLNTVTGFAGIYVVGDTGTDLITIGAGGVNLGAVTKGATNQSFVIDIGAGAADTITVANAIASKGGGAVVLTTLGVGPISGIQLAASVTTPQGSQVFDGAVTLQKATSLKAGGTIIFSNTVDGARRLTLSAGGSISFAGAIGETTPLRGITLSKAASVTVLDSLALDGTGTAAGTSGLVIAVNVNNVVLAAQPSTITGFSGSGIQFAGASTGSTLRNISSTGNGIGLQMGPGSYFGTVITGNVFSNNRTGVSLTNVRQLTLGGPTPANNGRAANLGNAITFNDRFGIDASGRSTGSVIQNNRISNNLLGNVRNLALKNGAAVVSSAPGLSVILNAVGLASLRAEQVGLYAFDLQISANGVAMSSTGALNFVKNLVDIQVGITPPAASVQSTNFRQIGSLTFVNAQSLGATGTPWVRLDSARQGAQQAVVVTNTIVTNLTPKHTLRSLEFPTDAAFVGSDEFGQRYTTNIGLSTFVALLPLYKLAGVRLPPIDNTPTEVDVWVDPKGYATRFTATVADVAITISLSNFG